MRTTGPSWPRWPSGSSWSASSRRSSSADGASPPGRRRPPCSCTERSPRSIRTRRGPREPDGVWWPWPVGLCSRPRLTGSPAGRSGRARDSERPTARAERWGLRLPAPGPWGTKTRSRPTMTLTAPSATMPRRAPVSLVSLLAPLLVMTGEPLGEFVLVFDLDQVHGVLLVDLGQGQGVRGGGGIGGVDPIDERLLVPKDQGCSIEHDRSTGGSSAQVTGALVHAARAWYSWISPQRISRRVIASGRAGPGPGIGRTTSCGRRRPSLRCGRCELWCAAY